MSKFTFFHFDGLYFFFGTIPCANSAHHNGSACPPSLRKVFTSFCSAVFLHHRVFGNMLTFSQYGGTSEK
jgi:hypothetical protein